MTQAVARWVGQRTVTHLIASLVAGALAAPARAGVLIPTVWEGSLFGRLRSCRGDVRSSLTANAVDGGRIRCRDRIITFDKRVVDRAGTLETSGTMCRRGQPRRRCCALTDVVVDGDFLQHRELIEYDPAATFVPVSGTVRTLRAGANSPRRVHPAGAIELDRIE